MAGELPLELRYDIYNLMKQKTDNANRESNNTHHEPSETRGKLGGFTKSMNTIDGCDGSTATLQFVFNLPIL